MKQEFREKLAQGVLSVHIEEIDFASFSPRYILASCRLIPDGSTEPRHVALWSRILTLLFEAHGPEEERDFESDERLNIRYKLSSSLAERFAAYLLGLSEPDLDVFTEQLREGCDAAPSFINYLLLHVAVLTERTQEKERYWTIWRKLSAKVQDIAVELAAHNYYNAQRDDKRNLIRGMLAADIQRQKVDYESQDIALGKTSILQFVANAGTNHDVFEAMARLMYHFPSIFFETGIPLLSRYLRESRGAELLEGKNTRFFLERSIQRYLRVDETGPLSRRMHQSCRMILNGLVESGSSDAYFLREHLIHSRRIV